MTTLDHVQLTVAATHVQHLVVGDGALAELATLWPEGAKRALVVADQRVLELHGEQLLESLRTVCSSVEVVSFPPGESSKRRSTADTIEDQLLALPARRTDVLVAFGGGVTTDLAGYVAARLLRGVRLVNVPTTVMAMVDAALGGKTAIDVPAGKNLIGAFHWPLAVVGDPRWLTTLPERETRSGLAEVIKHGVIADVTLLDEIALLEREVDAPLPASLLGRAAAVKAGVVEEDPYERGRRRILNFGHTVGHAVEAELGFAVPHGEAVAIGMAVEARVASRLLGFPEADRQKLLKLLQENGLPANPPCSLESAMHWMTRDKKNVDAAVRMSLPRRLGVMEPAEGQWTVPVPLTDLADCWDG